MHAFLIQTMARACAQMITGIASLRPMRAIVCAALMVSASEASAQPPAGDTSANTVFRGCKALVEGQTANTQLFALGNFCAGVVVGIASIGQQLSVPELQSCAPATSDARQLVRVVVNYIEAHPERGREDFKQLTLEALHGAWPCKSNR